MGAGGRMKPEPQPVQHHQRRRDSNVDHRRSPSAKPPFTVGQIKKAIPPHCFNRSIIRSFAYLLKDIVIVSAFLYTALNFIPRLSSPFRLAAWPIYWFAQGCVLTGVWVIAHECGHHAFSDYSIVDDIVGLVLHSALLVPYFSWKYSHRRHHSNTGSLERDEVFVPKRKSSIRWYSHYLNNPLGRTITLFITLTLGWPLYLLLNVSGRAYPRFACHFDPFGPIYNARERIQIFISDIGVAAVIYSLYILSVNFGAMWVVKTYGVPLLVVNAWLVTITYLQHTHPSLPHYDGDEWDWLRGALATMDRDYGFLNRVFHNITDTHVVHHLFSTMPHYHAMEATKAVKPVLGEYYQSDGTPVLKALYREARECLYVEAEAAKGKEKSGVYWFNNKL